MFVFQNICKNCFIEAPLLTKRLLLIANWGHFSSPQTDSLAQLENLIARGVFSLFFDSLGSPRRSIHLCGKGISPKTSI
jgi:hypothetical protein